MTVLCPKKTLPMLRNVLSVLFLFIFVSISATAQRPSIRVKIDKLDSDTILLANFFGSNQYKRDSAIRQSDGWFEFTRDSLYEEGMYIIVMPPDNQYFQIMMDGEQNFELRTEKGAEASKMKVKGSKDNEIFFDYLNFLSEMRPRAEAINAKKEGVTDEGKLAEIEAEFKQLNDEVTKRQDDLIARHPRTMTAALIRANQPLPEPEFEGTEEEIQLQRWRWSQQHFFDNVDLADPRSIRTPFLFPKVDNYINKMVVQHPDTIIQAIDRVLRAMQPAEDNFKFFLSHLLNTYAKSKIVGQDAIYVHLVNNYYNRGLAPWVEEETLGKIREEAAAMEPVLIGKDAPEIILETQSGERVNVLELDAEYTVLIFWRPGCGACKKAAPYMLDFSKKYGPQGVKTVSICTKFTDEVPMCWEFIKEKGWEKDLLNLVDPYHRSRFNSKYNVTGTPRIFILDENKKIVMKGIGAEQLDEVMEQLMAEK